MMCPFCEDNIVDRTYFESDLSFAIIAKHYLHPGQSLVVTKRHVESLVDLSELEVSDLMLTLKKSVELLQNVFEFYSFNVVLNNGQIAGQTISHLHFHIIPRKLGDIEHSKEWLNPALFAKLQENTLQTMINQSILIKNKRNIDKKN